jgi:trans-aconitate methyltransferase
MENFKEIRNEMLRLHKTLLDIEKANYEAEFGKLSPNQLLHLLFENEKFTWLRTISTLISEIDEMFASRKGIDEDLKRELYKKTHDLFDEEAVGDEEFKAKYRANLNTETDVAFHHVKILKLFAKDEA